MKKVEEVMKKIVAKGIVKIQEIIKKIKEYFFPTEVENVIVCEDVLSKEMCATLRKAAEKLKVGAKIVDQFIREALDKGKKKAKEIIKYIEDKMAALSKVKCEDILDEDICKKVREVAAKVKVEFKKVEEVMKKIVAKGIVKVQEIIKKIKEYFFPGMELELENEVKCEDVLAESLCAKIKAFAEAFKIKYAKIIEVMKTAIAKGLNKISEIIDYIKKHFPHLGEELVNEITCEEILSDKVCHDLREAAKKFKIKAEEIDKLVREALDKELRKAKDIIHYIRTKIVDMATNFKCTDALSEDVCAKIKEIAAKFKVDYQKVMKVIKDIIAKGITKAKEIIDEIKKHFFPQLEGELVNLVKCEDVLSPQVCTKMREIAAKLKIKVSEIDRIIH